MAGNISIEIPEDPHEAAAFLEQQLHAANDRLWALEDENREIANKLEFARENVKVLKRGYAEKPDEMQRKLDDRDRQLGGIREELQREYGAQLVAKDREIADLTGALEALKAQTKRMSLPGNEQPLTMQQLEECGADGQKSRRSSAGARGLSASPAWGNFPGPAMSPIAAWSHADKPANLKATRVENPKPHSIGGDNCGLSMADTGKMAASAASGVTSASLASMRETIKGSPASLAPNASQTTEQTRESSPEAEFVVRRAAMSPGKPSPQAQLPCREAPSCSDPLPLHPHPAPAPPSPQPCLVTPPRSTSPTSTRPPPPPPPRRRRARAQHS